MDEKFRVDGVSPLNFKKPPLPPDKKKSSDKHQHKEEAEGHFQQLIKAVEQAHEALERSNSPYRFSVLQKGNEIFIDVIIIDEQGNKKETMKNITHDEFLKCLSHIEQGKGLLFDMDT